MHTITAHTNGAVLLIAYVFQEFVFFLFHFLYSEPSCIYVVLDSNIFTSSELKVWLKQKSDNNNSTSDSKTCTLHTSVEQKTRMNRREILLFVSL